MFRSPSRTVALLTTLGLSLTAAAALPTALPATAAEGSTTPTAARATTSPISLWAPKQVTAYSYRNRAWTDLGLRVIANGAPFELWSERPSYGQQIRTVWRSPGGDVPLPAGAMSTFLGLDRFVSIEVTPRSGGATRQLSRPGCLNGWSERVRPDAPAHSSYPYGCWANPYSLGSVQGVQTGWATSVLSTDRPLPIPPGRYTVTARIAPRYASILGLSAADSTRTIALLVSKETGEARRTARAAHRSVAPGGPVARPAAHRPTGAQGRADAGGPVPNLRSLPAWGIGLTRNQAYLRFSATVWNAGDSPLVVDGFRRDGEPEMDAYQYFFDGAGNQTGYQPVGQMHWDPRPSHQHWHFEDFARYSLLDADKVEAVRSKKEAFCLANTDAVDLTVPDAAFRPDNTDLATSCGDESALSVREVLAAGWGDTYTQERAGQAFPIRDLPNGVYYIAVIANPDGNLVESSTADNVSLRRIRLGGTPGARTVRIPRIGIIDEGRYGGRG